MMSRLGVQLLAFGQRQRDDLAGVLAEVKQVGYDGAEVGGDGHGLLAAEVLTAAFRDAGLSLTGVHVGYGDCANAARVAELIAFLKQAGSRFLICSGVEDLSTISGYEASADTFNTVGQMCLDAGLTFCYHNHAWEFQPLEGGKQGIYTLLDRTCPTLVKLTIDVFWLHISGVNPAAFIARYADRVGYYHFKDGAKTPDGQTFIELGQGDVDLVGARDEALKHPLGWIVCEQDSSQLEPRTSIKQSFDYLKQIGL
jgi:sugar phosphate isomerase/epimerase